MPEPDAGPNWYAFLFASGGGSDKFQDDAPSAAELGVRLDFVRGEGRRLVTGFKIEEDEDGKKLEKPTFECTGSWDPKDIMHVVPFDEAGQVDLEGDEAEEEEAPAPLGILKEPRSHNKRK